LVGDFDRDGRVGYGDLRNLALTWLGGGSLTDLDGDRRSTMYDFALLAGNWRCQERPPLIVEKVLTENDGRHFTRLQEAVRHAREGDTILVKEGIYHESVVVDKEGIAIEAFDPYHPPVLDGADQAFVRPSWTHVQGKIYRTDYRWYKPQPTRAEFNTYGGGKSTNGIAMQVYEDNTLLRGYEGGWRDNQSSGFGAPYSRLERLDPRSEMYSPLATVKPDICIPGRFMYDEINGRLYVWGAEEDSPENHSYSVPVLEHLVVVRASNVTIRHLVLKNSAGYAVVLDGVADSRVMDCVFVNNMYAILAEGTDDTVIGRNFIQHKGMWERYWYYDCKDTVLYAHAIDLNTQDEDAETEIFANVIHGNYSAILARSSTTIHDNILSNCISTHINMGPRSSNVFIYRNACHHVDESSLGTANLDGGPIWVYRNLFYRCGALNKAGTSLSDEIRGECYFYHNALALSGLVVLHPYAYPVYASHVYRNNIFHFDYYESHEYYWKYTYKNASLDWNFFPFENGPDADYDLYWGVDPDNGPAQVALFSYDGQANGQYGFDSFEEMQSQTGLDPHGLQADPMLGLERSQQTPETAISRYDTLSMMDYRDVISVGLEHLLDQQFARFADLFGVEAGSPAVDRGVHLPSEWPDVVDAVGAAPDMGAWETSATTGSAPSVRVMPAGRGAAR